MMRSLFSGVSGLKNHQTRMDVIGNNISNVNTTGFKSSRVTFVDSLSQTLKAASSANDAVGGTNPRQIGLGSKVASVDVNFSDGSVQSTGINTDLCLSGNALFVVQKGNQTFYTRNGAFSFDADGNYVNADGLYVQGYMNTSETDHDSINTSNISNINLRAGKSMASLATNNITYVNNLNASTPTITSISYTKTDGTTGSTSSADDVVDLSSKLIKDDNATITLTLSDGQTVKIPESELTTTYTTGDSYAAGVTYDVKGVTANSANDVEFNISTDYLGITFPSPLYSTSGSTYSLGDTYNSTEIIATNGVTANTDGTVTLTFESGITVTIPEPPSGTYSDGDSFILTGSINTITPKTGATLALDGYPLTGGNYTLTADGTPLKVGSNTYSVPTSGETITSITRSSVTDVTSTPSGYVSAVLTLSDGTTQTVTSGKYTVGHSIPISTTVNVFDSLGAKHVVPISIERIGENKWIASLATNVIKEDDGTVTEISMVNDKTVIPFTASGAYDDSTGGTGILNATYTNGAAEQQVMIDFSNLTQYSNSTTANGESNGYAAGTLESVTIDESGVVYGTYTNGVLRKEAQVAVAQFTNAPGLTKSGNSLYMESQNSGTANIGTVTALGATITASALEMSNVDVAEEFSNMIITQRGFQSNSKIITVSDEMLENLINMKR
ncbi:flagellar hook protein FlgE [uncultured Anaerovibrio sp.]|uniref:flagellar hook protein FlgE n=1 Tax=uncultured Anaerovibrio sp. TaxID=361586 RepID=UPI00260ACF31|nr:flagellar hook-basal body complex protein [uncultured Anaerovibrio sp.]